MRVWSGVATPLPPGCRLIIWLLQLFLEWIDRFHVCCTSRLLEDFSSCNKRVELGQIHMTQGGLSLTQPECSSTLYDLYVGMSCHRFPQISGHVGGRNPSSYDLISEDWRLAKNCNHGYIYIYLYIMYIHNIIYIYCVIHHISHFFVACLHILLHIFISKLIEKKTKTQKSPYLRREPTALPPNRQASAPQGLRHLRWYRSETGRRRRVTTCDGPEGGHGEGEGGWSLLHSWLLHKKNI